MAKKSSKKLRKKRVKRIILVTIFCFSINAYVLYSVGTILKDVHVMKNENKELNVKLGNLKEEEEVLKSEVKKLKDPVYVAKYAREKFLYSGDDEYIIREIKQKLYTYDDYKNYMDNYNKLMYIVMDINNRLNKLINNKEFSKNSFNIDSSYSETDDLVGIVLFITFVLSSSFAFLKKQCSKYLT